MNRHCEGETGEEYARRCAWSSFKAGLALDAIGATWLCAFLATYCGVI